MKKLLFLLLVAMLAACGPMEHKRYDYTVSGTIYTDRETKTPVANWLVDVDDYRYSDVTVGASLDHDYFVQRTDENGVFCFNIKGGKISTTIQTGALYDVKGDSIVTYNGERQVGKTLYYETRQFYKKVFKNDVYQLHDLEIYLKECDKMEVSSLRIKRNQDLVITLPDYVLDVRDIGLSTLERYPIDSIFFCPIIGRDYEDAKIMSYGRKMVYYYENQNRNTNTVQWTLTLSDTIPAGYYEMDANVFTTSSLSEPFRFSRIVQIVDD